MNWFARDARTELQRANNELRSLKDKVGSPGLMAQKSARLGQINQELKQLQEQQRELDSQWKLLAGIDNPRRSEKIEQLAELLKRHGLNVIEQGQETGKQGTVPPALEVVSKRMGQRPPEVWRFRVRGSYAGMFRVMTELTSGDPAVTPLGLTLKDVSKDTQPGDIREWTLVVWI
jgi:hypothetical protein